VRRRTGVLASLVMLAGLGQITMCSAAERPALAPVSASALQQKVAAAIARDLQSDTADATTGSSLQVLAPSLSVPPDSELHVVSVRAGYSPGSWLLRMDCSSRRDCLPFHVVLYSPATSVRNPRYGNIVKALPQANDHTFAIKPSLSRPPLTRSGDHVLLVEERPGMRLRVTAVCLESGTLGDEIRVRNLATHRVLMATIASKDQVRVE
jgi:hypothetical protein